MLGVGLTGIGIEFNSEIRKKDLLVCETVDVATIKSFPFDIIATGTVTE
jgi:hypothetical protein